MSRLLIVSNRLPVSAVKRGETLRIQPSAGGLATGMSSLLKKSYKGVWIGWPGIAVEKITVREKNEIKKYTLLSQTVPCPWDKKGKVMRRLMEYSQERERQLIDGVRVIMDNAWILIAPDRRSASFYIYAEAKTKSQAEKLLRESVRKVKRWQR